MAMPKILVIGEGKTDIGVIKRMFSAYGKEVSVVSYKTDIYQLYSLYENQGVDYENIDVQQVFLDNLSSLKQSEIKILQDKYVDVFLVFDFDPQSDQADIAKLKKLLTHFSDSSDMGKLYINYPMMESYQHIDGAKLKSGEVDEEFFERRFTNVDLVRRSVQTSYKVRAKEEGFKYRTLSKDEWDFLIHHHLFKIEKLVGSLRSAEFSGEKFVELLEMQWGNYTKHHEAEVVNTSMMIIPELYPNEWQESEKLKSLQASIKGKI